MTCFYCDTKAIGSERVFGEGRIIRVCEDCAQVGAKVYLYAGGTYRKPEKRSK